MGIKRSALVGDADNVFPPAWGVLLPRANEIVVVVVVALVAQIIMGGRGICGSRVRSNCCGDCSASC
eukprot:SAG31_NODE_327_length_17650_cov_18.626574_12_plen_67_part_00